MSRMRLRTLQILERADFTGATIVNIGTVSGGAFNGTVGATTPSTVVGTTITASTEVRGTVLTSNAASTVEIKTSGGTQFAAKHVANVVNNLAVFGNITGNNPSLRPEGSDTNVSVLYYTKGTGFHSFSTAASGSNEQLRVAHTASAVEYLQATGAASGGVPTLSAQGASANVELTLASKGNAFTRLTARGLQAFRASSNGSAVNYMEVFAENTGASPILSANGSDSNIDMRLAGKGTGLVRFGTFTTDGAVSATGYIQIKASDGTTYNLLAVAA